MKVALLMGSDSDLARLEPCVATMRELEVPFVARVLSAHRSPQALVEFVAQTCGELSPFDAGLFNRAAGLRIGLGAAG